MDRKSFSDMHCSVAQCLEVVGEWWSLLIVRDAFLGVRRFDEFQSRLGISRNILNQRLARLVETGVLTKVPYSEHPPRSEYRLTDKGRDLWPVITTMRQWGDKHAAPHGPPLQDDPQGVRPDIGSPAGVLSLRPSRSGRGTWRPSPAPEPWNRCFARARARARRPHEELTFHVRPVRAHHRLRLRLQDQRPLVDNLAHSRVRLIQAVLRTV